MCSAVPLCCVKVGGLTAVRERDRMVGTISPPRGLTPSQADAFERIASGENVFVTGPGGTGKTHLLGCVRAYLVDKYGGDTSRFAFTGSTGVSAAAIGGVTIHSALGLGVPTTHNDFETRIAGRPATRSRVRGWRTLVLDEVGMISAEFFELLELAIRAARRGMTDTPLQWILVGDFHQLPPVTRRSSINRTSDGLRVFGNRGLAFEAPAWFRLRLSTCVLTEQIRQQDDETLAALLERLRSSASADELRATVRELREAAGAAKAPSHDGVAPTMLCSRNVDVDADNAAELDKLSRSAGARIFVIDSVDAADVPCSPAELESYEFFSRGCMAPRQLRVCEGAQVMLLKNLDVSRGLVNGSRGVVVDVVDGGEGGCLVRFSACPEDPILVTRARFTCELCPPPPSNTTAAPSSSRRRPGTSRRPMALTRTQLPLRLAWSMTVHKSQGMTIDRVHINMDGMRTPGQVYVAVSRARSLAGLSLSCSDEDLISMPPQSEVVSSFYRSLLHQSVTRDEAAAYAYWQTLLSIP